jgi:glycosyltransferase involved in cell wall biosynthesis
LTGRKRPHDLADAVLKLAKIRTVQCTFIGDVSRLDTLPESFQNLVHDGHPALRFTGPLTQAQIAEEFRDAHVFCLPSGDESYPLAPLEAALSGLPIVQSALAPYPSIGWENNLNCLSYPVGNIPEMMKQLLKIAEEPELVERLSHAGFELANSMKFEKFCVDITSRLLPLVKLSDSMGQSKIVFIIK